MLLEIDDLSVSYRNDEGEVNPAAIDVNLTLDRGQVLGIVGESGSGKSPVSMSVARLRLPLPELRKIRGKRIGVIFQDPMGSLSPLHRIGDQLVETVLLHERMSEKAARALALEWLGKVGIPDPTVRERAYPHELSGGMQQRVMIAMGLMLGPDLVIADEPTTALDVTIQAQVLRLMRELHKANSGVLLITHDLGVVSQMATKLAVMKDGRVIETADDPAAFFAGPRQPYSQGLVREARRMELK